MNAKTKTKTVEKKAPAKKAVPVKVPKSMTELRGMLEDTEKKVAELQEQNSVLSKDLAGGRTRETNLQAKLVKVSKLVESQAATIANSSKRIAELEKLNEDRLSYIKGKEARIVELNAAAAQAATDKGSLEESLDKLEAQLEAQLQAQQTQAAGTADVLARTQRDLEHALMDSRKFQQESRDLQDRYAELVKTSAHNATARAGAESKLALIPGFVKAFFKAQ